jgi:RluA family pseudouridine synthase
LTKPELGRYHSIVPEQVTVPANETPKKLDAFLKKRFPVGYVRKLFRKNAVRLNGRRAEANDEVQPGNEIHLFIPFETQTGRSRPPRTLKTQPKVIFEDATIVVLDKPAGLAVHEGKNILKRDSVLGILEQKYRSQQITPKLVHRLDRNTSGVLIVAKNETTMRALEEAFYSGRVEKEYLCLVAGKLEQNQGKIDFPLPGRKGSKVRAFTRFRAIKKYSDVTFLQASIDTGRMHQIRLHFAKLGYPIVMDDQHGDFTFNKKFRKEYGLKRQFLHAARLSLHHNGKQQTWRAPLAADLEETLKALDLRRARAG